MTQTSNDTLVTNRRARPRGTLVAASLSLALAWSTVSGTHAAAQSTAGRAALSPDATEAQARAHFELGREHAAAERWTQALVEFQASEELAPRAVTEFNLAATFLRLGRARDALVMVERLEARDDLDARIADDVVTLRAAARDAIRTLALALTPADARVEIDGSVIEGTGSPRAIPLDPGPHAIVVTAPGFREHRATLSPDAVTLAVELTTEPAVLEVRASEPDAEIAIDGTVAGLGHVEREVAVGSHHVHVTRDGRLPFDRDVEVRVGERSSIDATLVLPPPTPLHEEPLLWVGVGAGVLALAGVAIGIGLASAPQPSGGSSGILIAPLVSF